MKNRNPYKKWNKNWWKWYWSEVTCIPYRVRKVLQWLPLIWLQEDWDQSFLYELLAFKFERMEKGFIHVGEWGTQKKDLLICKNLMRRLERDEYLDFSAAGSYKYHPYFKNELSVKHWSNYESAMQKQDKELFCKIFLRKVDTWWD